jgi:hypothetical protein
MHRDTRKDEHCLEGPVQISRYSNLLRTRRSGWRDFSHPSGPTLGPTQPPIQWVPGHPWGWRWPMHGVNHPPPCSAEVNKGVDLYLCSPSVLSRQAVGWTLTFTALPKGSQPSPAVFLIMEVFRWRWAWQLWSNESETRNQSTRRKTCLSAFGPPQISHELPRDRNPVYSNV